jgi:pimeloyl-ACP methyl ester carboxylesterase
VSEAQTGFELARRVVGGVARSDERIEVGELSLHAVCWGDPDAPPVLLLHGNGGHAHWWDALVPSLVRGRRLIALDSRGHGESDWPEPPSYRLDAYEADLLAVVEAFDLPPLPIVAHSMGGRAALHFAAHQPDRVTGLAMLDTTIVGIKSEEQAWYLDKIRGRREGRIHDTSEAALAGFRLIPPEPGVPDAVHRDVAHHAIGSPRPGEWRVRFDYTVLMGDGNDDLTPLFADLPFPVWIGSGADGGARPDEARLRTIAPELVMERFPGAHHFLLSNPAPLAAWLERFLSACNES